MRKIFLFSAIVCACFIGTNNANAQGFLNKVKKATDKVAQTTAAVTGSDDSGSSSSINWSEIPIYTAQEYVVVDENNNPVLNEDGTQVIRVFLVDQNGNKRSAETVKAQQNALYSAAGKIIAKVGIGAGKGALSGGGKGAIAGAASGAIASAGDIKTIKDQKKSLDNQKKLLKAYQQNFTEEGVPVDATADLSKVKDLNINKENSNTMTEAEFQAIISDPSYKDTSVEGMSLEELDIPE